MNKTVVRGDYLWGEGVLRQGGRACGLPGRGLCTGRRYYLWERQSLASYGVCVGNII